MAHQKTKGRGKAVVEKLAADIQSAFPSLEGFSARNVWRMRAFFLAYSDAQFLPQAVAEIKTPKLALPVQENVSFRAAPDHQ